VDGEADGAECVEDVGTSTATKLTPPLLALFSTYVISLAYSFDFFLLPDLQIRLAGR
jgi:hypothetical protein